VTNLRWIVALIAVSPCPDVGHARFGRAEDLPASLPTKPRLSPLLCRTSHGVRGPCYFERVIWASMRAGVAIAGASDQLVGLLRKLMGGRAGAAAISGEVIRDLPRHCDQNHSFRPRPPAGCFPSPQAQRSNAADGRGRTRSRPFLDCGILPVPPSQRGKPSSLWLSHSLALRDRRGTSRAMQLSPLPHRGNWLSQWSPLRFCALPRSGSIHPVPWKIDCRPKL